MSEHITIFLTTGVALILILYTLAVLMNDSRYIVGKVRVGIILQLLGVLMVSLGFLWGALSIMLGWQNHRFWQQILLFAGILFMFFAARRLFRMEKPKKRVPVATLPPVRPHRAGPGIMLFFVSVGLVLALSVPVTPTVRAQSLLLTSIQQQLNDILAAALAIQARLAEMLEEQQNAAEQAGALPGELVLTDGDTAVSLEESLDEKQEPAVVYPLWEFVPLPSTYLSVNLAVLYRFSITAGAEDVIIPSVTYTIAYADISIKDLKVHAFSDEFFSVRAFDNAAKNDVVGTRNGYLVGGEETVTIPLENDGPGVVLSAGKTLYFELHGVPVGKNISAFATVFAEGLPEVTLR